MPPRSVTWLSSSSAPPSPSCSSTCPGDDNVPDNTLTCRTELVERRKVNISKIFPINPDRVTRGTHTAITCSHIVITSHATPSHRDLLHHLSVRLLTSVYEAVTIHKQLECHEAGKDYLPLWFLYCIAAMNALLVSQIYPR